MTISDKERQIAFNYCNNYLTGSWCKVNTEQISISAVTGGTTNQLYRCSLNEDVTLCADEPRQVLLRIYGPAKDDVPTDVEIFKQLASAGLGPRLHSTFEQGRFEEYLPSHALKWQEMTSDIVAQVMAHKIAAIHQLDVDLLDKNSNWLLDKYRQYGQFIEASKNSELIFGDFTPESSRIKAKHLMNIDFELEIALLKDLFTKTQIAPLVFSHNDLHHNNVILLHNQNLSLEERVILIDFEYSSYNYRTFDVANHLCEWCCNFDNDDYPYFDFSLDRFPSIQKQKQFLKDYIDGLTNQSKENNKNVMIGYSSLSKERMVETLFNEMQPCLMASNLLWAMWAIQSALTSKIRFGYWEMAQSKWDCYLLTKRQLEHQFSSSSNHQNGE